MFSTARNTAKSSIAKIGPEDNSVSPLPYTALPPSYTLCQINQELIEDGHSRIKDEAFTNVLVIASCLDHPEKLLQEPSDFNADIECAIKVLRWLSRVILPDGSIVANDEVPGDGPRTSRQRATQQMKLLSQQGLQAMTSLLSLEMLSASKPDQNVLLSLLAFTDSRDAWTTSVSHQKAQQLLERFSKEVYNSDFMVEFVLRNFLRLLFSRSKPAAITATGRKAMATSAPQKGYDPTDLDPANKPWKFKDIYAVTVFQWVVNHSQHKIVSESWPLFIPPLLTLLDDSKTEIRSRGLEILGSFLFKFPARHLKQTGLGEVFEDAVMPTLLYLPNLTPVDESITLLRPAYNTLYILANARFPSKEDQAEKMKSMDRIMRHGILQGYHHSSEHPQIVQVLVEEIEKLANKMQIRSVKYLKDTVPILSSVLTNPFAASQPSLLLSTVKALRSTILNCWPRISQPVHFNEITKALALCWGTVTEEDFSYPAKGKEILQSVKQELQITGRVLVKSVEGEVDITEELKPLLKADPSLSKLFETAVKTQSP